MFFYMRPRLEISFSKAERLIFKNGISTAKVADNAGIAEIDIRQFMLNHCRSGIVIALEALHLPKQSGVGVMAYNCHTVMNAVWQAGLTPIFIDINDDLELDIEDLATKVKSIRVLIVTHLFGIINDINIIKQLFPDLIIIEDCAHAFAHNIEGDFGVYSIGQGKFPSVGDGGILVVNNDEYLPEIAQTYSTLKAYTQVGEMKLYCRLLLHAIMNKPYIYQHITLKLKKNRNSRVSPEIQAVKTMSKGIRRLLAEKQRNYREAILQRKLNATQLAETLNLQDYKLGENAFMLVARSSAPAVLQQKLYEMGIDSATHFANCISWAKEYGYNNDCPKAEKMTQELLMIPIYSTNDNNKINY